MKINIIDRSDKKLTFVLQDTTPQFANAIRRISMVEVPNLAVSFVDFNKNDSVLYDEIISHRLALVPLVFNPKDFDYKDTCQCEGKGCSLCEVVFAINKKGPCKVYTKDMKSSNPNVKPLYDNILIVELDEKQSIKLAAVASLGTGRDHAKFNSAVSFYKYYPSAELTGQLKNTEECMKACPKNALEIKGNKATVTLECDLCQECVKTANPALLKVSGDETKFIFTVESISGLTAEQIITTSIDILKKKAKEIGKDIKKLK